MKGLAPLQTSPLWEGVIILVRGGLCPLRDTLDSIAEG